MLFFAYSAHFRELCGQKLLTFDFPNDQQPTTNDYPTPTTTGSASKRIPQISSTRP